MREGPSLNGRKWSYLEALYRHDQAAEQHNRWAWRLGEERRPASEFRWIPYELGALAMEPTLKTALRRRGLVDQGTGSTWKALEERGLVALRGRVDLTGTLPGALSRRRRAGAG